jgi:hypothetical protein
MVTILASQPDFAAQRSWLCETVENAGHEFIMFPKFHCELNFIELYWAEAKRLFRERCEYSTASLRANVPLILDEINSNLTKIRRMARHCYRCVSRCDVKSRFMDAYRHWQLPQLVAFAVKKYRGHRMIPNLNGDLVAAMEYKQRQ